MSVTLRSARTLTFMLLVPLCILGQSTNSTNDQQQQLIQLEQKWLDAENDPDALQTILADDFIHVLPAGFVTKKEQLDFMRSHPSPKRGDRKFEDLKVRIFGTTAVVTGVVAANPGDGSIHETAFTDVFVYRDARWQAVNAQESPMAESSNQDGNSTATLPSNLKADVAAGNQAWIDGLKANDTERAVSAFAPDAIFCTSAGKCLTGTVAISSLYKDSISKYGRATDASVHSESLRADHDLAYESGHAEVDFPHGVVHEGRFSTVWKLQPDGHWKIVRNLSLAAVAR